MLNSLRILQLANKIKCLPMILQTRNGMGFGGSSYYDSKLLQGPEAYTGVEKSFDEWKHVLNLIPPEHVPSAPVDPTKAYPSGWKPQSITIDSDLQYIIRRTKNHMIPVYLQITNRGQRRNTRIRRIEGNIWALEKHVGQFLETKYPSKIIITFAHECYRFINIRGDHVDALKEWLQLRGF